MRGFDPGHHDFYDEADLEQEMDRIYDICHGCRLCWNLCPSFPFLFDTIDERDLDHASELTGEEKWRVVDLCYNCKLCNPKCPYIPPHDYELDFPALMLRAKAVKAKHQGITTRDKFLGNPGLVGRIGGISSRMTNAMNEPGSMARKLMEKTLGIDASRKLPPIAEEPFERWFEKRGGSSPKGDRRGAVALFHTCSVNHNWPSAGRALVEVLEHNGYEVIVPEQRCCGMPALDGGDIETATEWAQANLDALHAVVSDGIEVLIPGPSCSLMIRHDYPTLLKDERAAEVAAHAHDAAHFLMKLHKEGGLDLEFAWTPKSVAYHQPCHLRLQQIGFPGRDLLQLTGAEVTLVEKCSGMDGTWGMKKEFYPLSIKQAKKLSAGLEKASPELFSSDCPLASLQVEEVADRRPLHPVEILHRAYGLSER